MTLGFAIGAVVALMFLFWIAVPVYCVWSVEREARKEREHET